MFYCRELPYIWCEEAKKSFYSISWSYSLFLGTFFYLGRSRGAFYHQLMPVETMLRDHQYRKNGLIVSCFVFIEASYNLVTRKEREGRKERQFPFQQSKTVLN